MTEDLVLELNDLNEEVYIVYIEVEWVKPELINSFVLSTFSDHTVSIEAADKNEYYRDGRYIVLEELMKSCAQKNQKSRVYYDQQRGPIKSLYKVIAINDSRGGDIGYIYYSNFKV